MWNDSEIMYVMFGYSLFDESWGVICEETQSVRLESPFSEVEIKSAIWCCGEDRAPGPDDKQSIWNMKRVLRCFQLSAWLKINFVKSTLIGVGIEDSVVHSRVDDLGCSVGTIPFRYLGLPVGANPAFKIVWDPIIVRNRECLAKWKSRVPSCVLEEIDKIRRSFFWAKHRNKRKLCTMDWNTITKSRRNGGLGVENLRTRNKKEALWRKLIVAKYGKCEFSPSPSKPRKYFVSPRWKKISDLVHLQSFSSNAARSGLMHCVGRGNNTRFWEDHWVEGHILKVSFPRMFGLAAHKACLVSDFSFWEDG
ncbi:hypothetical protein CTI12_AA518920 [Artemisia annua]|uniref:RNA-directed DNA polymerase, eukaryota, Reverse transcriptase zinc-binding domain protein n=1 Tax=Artemisia annua TaxID=35608 RepID=A0A2U1L8I0_ARTAN|nr:hypothetical protein CTI12_AA518920 [Artemisia annua]